jgi:hypothetical protein
LWHNGSPSARSFSRSPSPPPPQSPSPPRSQVLDGQTSPLRPRLVVSRSTCPPLSPSPHANSFVIGTAVCYNHIHTQMSPTRRVALTSTLPPPARARGCATSGCSAACMPSRRRRHGVFEKF